MSGILELGDETDFLVRTSNFKFFSEDVSTKLALSGVFSEFDGILGGLSGFLSGSDQSLGILPGGLHFAKLLVDDPISENRSCGQDRGKEANPDAPLRYGSLVPLVIGVGFLFLSLCSAMAIVKGTEYAEVHGIPWWLPFIAFLGLTYFFSYHGLQFLERYDRESKTIYTNLKSSAPARLRSVRYKV